MTKDILSGSDITSHSTESGEAEKAVEGLTQKIMNYESGQMTHQEEVSFFQELINSGLCWSLQGHYGRTAIRYIEQGVCENAKK